MSKLVFLENGLKLKNKAKQVIEEKKKEGKTYKRYKKKKGIKSYDTWIFDFETLTFFTKTYKEKDDTQIILWAGRRINIPKASAESGEYIVYNPIKNSKNGKRQRQDIYDTDKFVVNTDGNSFIDFVLNIPRNTVIYFHNLSYDGSFIIPLLSQLKELEQVHYNLEDNGISVEGLDSEGNVIRNYWDIFRNGSKIFKIILRKRGLHNLITIEFRCTLLMLSSSVSKLGSCLAKSNETFMNKPLSKFLAEEEQDKNNNQNFYNVEPYENIETMVKENPGYFYYCLRDVEIVRRSYLYFQEMINDLPRVKEVNTEKEEHNKIQLKLGRKTGMYKNLSFNIWDNISIAGGMRKLLKQVYIPYFQSRHKQYSMFKRYKHNKKLYYGNFSQVPIETHRFFTEPRSIFNDDNAGKSKFFRGGFTQLNPALQNMKKGHNVGDCGKWDISSAYPFQMCKNLPFGILISEEDFWDNYSNLPDNEYYEFLEIPVLKAIPKDIAKYCATLPNIQKLESKKGIYRYVNTEMEKFTLCLVRQEWEELQHWYTFILDKDIEIKRTYMLAAPFLRDISIELYQKKDEYHQSKLEAQKQGAKIAINSVYGSMGIREKFDSLIFMNEKDVDYLNQTRPKEFGYERSGSKTTSCDIKHKSLNIYTGNYWGIYISEHNDKSKHWNIAAAAVITALERVYLMETIRRVGPEYFGYCDTDSIIFVNMDKQARKRIEAIELEQPIKKVLEFSEYAEMDINIGTWEVEYRYIKEFIPHKAKEYTQVIYSYDEKQSCFLDTNGNRCKKENAATFKKAAHSGFSLPDTDTDEGQRLESLFFATLKERQQLSNEEIDVIYKEIENKPTDFYERIRQGETLIREGNKITLKKKSGNVLVWEDKWTKYGNI